MGSYQPTEKFKNFSLQTSKPLKSHALYKQKEWTLQEQILKKLKKLAEFITKLHSKLKDDSSQNIKDVIGKNLEIIIKDLDLMQKGLHESSYSFNTTKLKVNQRRITEMKNVCDTLQTVSSYENEFKNLGKIKHTLNELEHLIQPTSSEKKAGVKRKPKTVPAKKKTKPATKLREQKKTGSKPPAVKLKSSKQKIAKPKRKTPAKKIVKAKKASTK